jgi:hypothetical protein
MPIVLISSGPHGLGKELAENLKAKTGWPLLGREQLVEQARDQGIKLGRLETSIIKSPSMHEKLAREKELYLAFVTAKLCEHVVDGKLIYYGRAGHLMLPGVSHRLRVGLEVPREIRINQVMRDLHLPREKAQLYLEQLDGDIEKWIRYVHRENTPKDPGQYDVFFNLQNMSLANAAVLLCETAELPDFRPTPASLKLVEDLHLAARTSLRLAEDEHTRNLDLGVRAVGGVVTVTYMPRQEDAAQSISKVLQDLEGCRETLCTMAETNILWVQEGFDPNSDTIKQVLRLARRWGAAVELLRLVPGTEKGYAPATESEAPNPVSRFAPQEPAYTGGVEDDEAEAAADDGGLSATQEELVSLGRSAGAHTVYGDSGELVDAVKHGNRYSLVILGNLFLSKGPEARTRQVRELGLALREVLKAPVITAEELQSRFLFGKKQALKLLLVAAATLVVYVLIFSFQTPILNLLGGEMHAKWKLLTSIGVALFVPLVAYIYSTVTGLFLKLINID